MVDKDGGLRDDWARLVGKPHKLGMELLIDVSDTKFESTEYQIRGVVDIPSHAASDPERDYLAEQLFDVATIPQKDERRFRLANWKVIKGGDGVTVLECRPIPIFTEKDVINLKIYTPPDIEELTETDEISEEQHNEWASEYIGNQYCRFESRKELNQRWQDIQVNTQVLKPSGKIGLTDDPLWFQLGQHVITEMLLRGEPLNETNLHPDVPIAGRFLDGELCAKAAEVVARNGSQDGVVVKYGKSEHMKSLFEDGLIYLNSASAYDGPTHNPAVRDDERAIEFRGAYSQADAEGHYFNRETAPENVGALSRDRELKFSLIFDCPTSTEDECVNHRVHMRTDYWMFCMANVLDQRLFTDFEADSCVIIQRDPFLRRLDQHADSAPWNTTKYFANVQYVDPLGAFPGTRECLINGSLHVYLTKLFRYAYQHEVRFVCIPPEIEDGLRPHQLQMGSLKNIAEYVQL